MRLLRWSLPVLSILLAGCKPQPEQPALTTQARAAVEDGVRRFLHTVAQDVTSEGPAAWGKYFADTPAFFMAVDGSLAFASHQAAAEALKGLAQTLKRVELRWEGEARIDPLTTEFAVVATVMTP